MSAKEGGSHFGHESSKLYVGLPKVCFRQRYRPDSAAKRVRERVSAHAIACRNNPHVKRAAQGAADDAVAPW